MDQTKRPFWFPDMQGFIAGAVIVMAAGALAYRMTHPDQVEDKVLDMMLTIVFSTAFVAIINYLFGSSRGSEKKDDAMIERAIVAAPQPPAAPVSTTTTVTDASTVTRTEPAPAPVAPAAPAAPANS